MSGIISYILVMIKKIITNLTTVDNHVVRNYNELTDPVTGLDAIKTATGTVDGRLTSATDGLGAIKTGVDNANGTLGNGTYGLAAIKTAVDAIGSGGSSGGIKSFQSGVALPNYHGQSGINYHDVTVSTIDTTKSLLIVSPYTGNGQNSDNNACGNGYIARGYILNSTTIRICGAVQLAPAYWYLIEFN